ncbi:MAG: hypothetical protein JWQ56_3541 [Pseudarthrobacter sp.]|nr:hypothetical protein [Pseudarthrobacter sp.]
MGRNTGKQVMATLASAIVLMAMASPASAALSASLQPLSLPLVPYSHQGRTITGSTVLTASDDTLFCTPQILLVPAIGSGWRVSLQATDFRYTGPNQGANISAGNLAVASVQGPVTRSGMAVDQAHGPRVPGTSPVGSLSHARIVLTADPGYGCGTYTLGINLALALPAGTRAGTYTSTLTTTITAGP